MSDDRMRMLWARVAEIPSPPCEPRHFDARRGHWVQGADCEHFTACARDKLACRAFSFYIHGRGDRQVRRLEGDLPCAGRYRRMFGEDGERE